MSPYGGRVRRLFAGVGAFGAVGGFAGAGWGDWDEVDRQVAVLGADLPFVGAVVPRAGVGDMADRGLSQGVGDFAVTEDRRDLLGAVIEPGECREGRGGCQCQKGGGRKDVFHSGSLIDAVERFRTSGHSISIPPIWQSGRWRSGPRNYFFVAEPYRAQFELPSPMVSIVPCRQRARRQTIMLKGLVAQGFARF